ncbi:Caudovirales tail fibre assembly protein [Serratia proteamaculans]|uniref:tail fiber assembly protein n=1 Tax=Serratia proteamaculans TaxID=28151 RepID=UPI0021836421|nr:tail fiber assembly protein [Serratia proteamaculans]CAI2427909.1 Caudovirales tail fibre assembly protein [Serratia proteamaculans]
MNNYKFSATTTGFYPVSMLDSYDQAGTLPTDLVDVTDEGYDTFTGTAPEGKTRGSNKGGQPAWVDIPKPTPEQMRSQAIYRKQAEMAKAEDVIAPLERAVKLDMATDEEKAQLDAWERYSVLLSRVDTDKAPDIEWPERPE